MKQKKYTEKIHAEGLLIIFGEDNPCDKCPSVVIRKHFFGKDWNEAYWNNDGCNICWNFILEEDERKWAPCPCQYGNEDNAAKRTWIVLEEKEYI